VTTERLPEEPEESEEPVGLPGRPELAIVSGMSGAGRSTAARALEDLGWFVVDNLPPALLPTMLDLIGRRPEVDHLAVVVDVRGRTFFTHLRGALNELAGRGVRPRVLYLEAGDEALVRRFESARRPHPLQGRGRVLDGIAKERDLLRDLRGDADLVIDTSVLNVHELARKVINAFADEKAARLRATVMSFGYKYGIPVDADLVVDVRFLPNPHWVPELRPHTGLDQDVNDYVLAQKGAVEFLDRYADLLHVVAEGYLREGKRYITVAVGCTGGKHRSVTMSEHLARRLVKDGVETIVFHRDMGRE
jgi:RNase adapter protein RapZ